MIEPEEISLDDITVWNAKASFTNGTLSFSEQWAGGQIWFNEKDISYFKTIEITYKDCTGNVQCHLNYMDESKSDTKVFVSGAGTLSVNLVSTKKLQSIFFQGQEAGTSITLEKIILKP